MSQEQNLQGRPACLCQCLAAAIPKPLPPDFELLLLTLLSQELVRTGVSCKNKRCGLVPCFISPDSRGRDLSKGATKHPALLPGQLSGRMHCPDYMHGPGSFCIVASLRQCLLPSPPWDALQASALLGGQQAAPQPRRCQALPAAQPATRLLAEPPPSQPAHTMDTCWEVPGLEMFTQPLSHGVWDPNNRSSIRQACIYWGPACPVHQSLLSGQAIHRPPRLGPPAPLVTTREFKRTGQTWKRGLKPLVALLRTK